MGDTWHDPPRILNHPAMGMKNLHMSFRLRGQKNGEGVVVWVRDLPSWKVQSARQNVVVVRQDRLGGCAQSECRSIRARALLHHDQATRSVFCLDDDSSVRFYSAVLLLMILTINGVNLNLEKEVVMSRELGVWGRRNYD